MAVELELTVKIRYEPNPAHYIDEDTTVTDMSPDKMAAIDQTNYRDDPQLLIELIGDIPDEDITVEVQPVIND